MSQTVRTAEFRQSSGIDSFHVAAEGGTTCIYKIAFTYANHPPPHFLSPKQSILSYIDRLDWQMNDAGITSGRQNDLPNLKGEKGALGNSVTIHLALFYVA